MAAQVYVLTFDFGEGLTQEVGGALGKVSKFVGPARVFSLFYALHCRDRGTKGDHAEHEHQHILSGHCSCVTP